jgi:hypothetical protein
MARADRRPSLNKEHSVRQADASRDTGEVERRFSLIRAALDDLQSTAFGIRPYQTVQADRLLHARYENRLMTAFLLLSHLRDHCTRLAKARGLRREVVTRFVEGSLSVNLCVRAGDTWKHGRGGRHGNATVTKGLICVLKSPKGEPPGPQSDSIVIGMALVDAEFGVFHSHVVLDHAIRDWVTFLASTFALDLRQEVAAWLPEQKATHVVAEGERPEVPPGSVLEMPFPAAVITSLMDDLKRG